MPSKSRSNSVVGCLVLLVVAGLIISACNAVFGIDTSQPAPVYTPEPVYTPADPPAWETPTPTPVRTRKKLPDLDKDGTPDRRDRDADGDGVSKSKDADDRDADVGEPEPEPEPEPAVGNAHPGGFCGTEGAVGIASNGRTYVCRGGHWRR